MTACLDDNAIAALIAGALSDAERATAIAHIDECDSCRGLVADTARTSARGAGLLRSPGAALGRYIILETVGAGAMGVVYAAYDPGLDRKVALKVLRTEPSSDGSSAELTQRLLREAHALAKLAHPNVVTVHDAGTIDGEVFIAMEFVGSGTLRDWLDAREPPRSVSAALDVFRQAGEGLAAAHDAGLEHRDFKPDNVLVGADGRARVTDFGLARRAGDGVGETRAAGTPPGALDATLTRTGALIGTPAYMAPERLRGDTGDARSDQFGFCVAFHEALYGERPFAERDLVALTEAIDQGRVQRPPAGSKVPAWLRRVVLRGLEADPGRRFPTMRALLDALAAGTRTKLTPLRIAAGLGALLALGVLIGALDHAAHPAAPVCTGAQSAWGSAWDASRAEAIGAKFQQSGRPSATFALGQVTRALDAYRDGWVSMHRDACEATRVRGEQSEALLDLRMRCLDDRRKQVDALARLLAEADGSVVDRSISATMSLPPTLDCANTRALSTEVPPPDTASRATIDALRDRLAESSALEYAGQYARGLAIAKPALEAARATAYAPIVARLLFVSGRLTYGANDFPAAEPLLHEAAAWAIDAHEDLVAADAWTALVRIVGTNEGRFAEAKTYARYAEAAIHRAGGDAEREATRLRYLATIVWRREHKLDEARALIERARALFASSHSSRLDFDVASCDEGIAGIEFDRGRPELALPVYQRVAEVRERLFGENHPSVAVALVNLGETMTKLGRAQEALPILRRSIELSASRAAKGGDAYEHHRLAAALRATGDAPGALAEDELARAACDRAGETGGYWESFPLTGLGLDLLALGKPREAVPLLERAIELRAKNPVVFEVSESRFALARALWEMGAKGDSAARSRARVVAAQARDDLKEDAERYGGTFAASRDEIDAWLATAEKRGREP